MLKLNTRFLSPFMIGTTMGLILVGCADKNADDYTAQKTDQLRAMIEQHTGTYEGTVTTPAQGSAPFTLKIGRANVIAGATVTALPQVLMAGSMYVQSPSSGSSNGIVNTETRKFDFDSAQYTASNGRFVQKVIYTDPSNAANSYQLDFDGYFDGNTVHGTIVANGYDEWKSTFVAQLNAQASTAAYPPAVAHHVMLAQTKIPADFSLKYSGNLIFKSIAPPSSVDGKTGTLTSGSLTSGLRQAELYLDNPTANSVAHNSSFPEYFSPIKNIEATVKIGLEEGLAPVQKVFSGSLDLRRPTPVIYGHVPSTITASTSTLATTLGCNGTSDGGWVCDVDFGTGEISRGVVFGPQPRY